MKVQLPTWLAQRSRTIDLGGLSGSALREPTETQHSNAFSSDFRFGLDLAISSPVLPPTVNSFPANRSRIVAAARKSAYSVPLSAKVEDVNRPTLIAL